MECGVCCVECGVWSVKFVVCCVDCEVWSVKCVVCCVVLCGVWNMECGGWNVECEV